VCVKEPLLSGINITKIFRLIGKIPKEISLEDKTEMEQFKLMQQLDDEDKQTVMKIINTMLTKAKLKDFFNKNIAALLSKSPCKSGL